MAMMAINSFAAEYFFVFELGAEQVLLSVEYSYKSQQQTLWRQKLTKHTVHTVDNFYRQPRQAHAISFCR